MCGRTHIEAFKRRVGLGYTYKWLQVISNINNYTIKKLKNKAFLSLNNIACVAKWSLVTYCNIQLTDDAWFHQ